VYFQNTLFVKDSDLDLRATLILRAVYEYRSASEQKLYHFITSA